MPDTMNYMLIGYGLAYLLLMLLAASIWWRYRSLAADEAALHQLEQDSAAERNERASLEQHDPAQVR